MKPMTVHALLLAGLPLLLIHPIAGCSAGAETPKGEPPANENPFAAYPWFPLPDPLTREQPDATLAAPPGSTPPPYTLFADINYDPAWWQRGASRQDPLHALKFIPLDPNALIYVSFGGEVRERFESWQNENFRLVPSSARSTAYWLERIMLHMDLRLGPYVRVFVQGKSNSEEGREGGPRPVDVDTIDLHQAFVDLSLPLSTDSSLTLRGGRQEIGFGIGRLIDPREGPNVRLSFDGVREMLRWKDWELDAFWLRPVPVDPYDFDESSNAQQLWGAYLAGPGGFKNTGINLYYFGDFQKPATYFAGVHTETRHTVGGRYFGRIGDFDFDLEGAWQGGSFGADSINAFFASSEIGYAFPHAFGTPHLSLKTDIFSGSNAPPAPGEQSQLGTFNPLFPAGIYFSDPSPIGEQNIIALHPQLNWYPWSGVDLTLSPIWYWRESTSEGLYNFAGAPLAAPANRQRFAGVEIFLQAAFQVNEHLAFTVEYDHFFIGGFLSEQPGARDSDFVAVWATIKF
jgi:Alginate export